MLFPELDKVKAAVIGDFCLDVYWYADMTKSRLSRETAHFPKPVMREKMSPGGAGNVAANLAALNIEKVYAVGVVGDDWRRDCLVKALCEKNVETSGLIPSDKIFTNTYIKPMCYGYAGEEECTEDARLDFEASCAMDKKTEEKFLAAVKDAAQKADVICVCDQMEYGCITKKVREYLCGLGKNGKLVIVDSRDRIGLYENVTVKPNDIEASRATGMKDPSECAKALYEKTGRNAIVTCGENGCIVCENGNVEKIPAFSKEGKTDICGAGDTFLSAYAAFTAAGYGMKSAAALANAASCVTVHKVGTTGTASRTEISAICPYNPISWGSAPNPARF